MRLEVKFLKKDGKKIFANIRERNANLRPLLKQISELLVQNVKKNIETGGNPEPFQAADYPWQQHVVVKKSGEAYPANTPHAILMWRGELHRSIEPGVNMNTLTAYAASPLPYARALALGNPRADEKITRDFFKLRPEFKPMLRELFHDHYLARSMENPLA